MIRAPRIAVFALFVLLAVVHTWPLAQNPGVHSRVDSGDYGLNVWAVDWVAHTLPTDPLHLFDANIFHPARLTLAYSEPLILQGILAIPARWLGLSPVATHNLVLLAGFALSGWAFALFAHRETGSWIAGIVTGSAVAFNAHQLVRLTHIQALHLELVPLVFLALDQLVVTGRLRYAAAFGAALALQAAASIYLLVFTGWAAICGALVRLPECWPRLRAVAVWTLVAGATCALLLAPVLWPYVDLASTQGLKRSSGEAQTCAASWTDYLYTGSRVHHDAWSYRFRESADANFPGLTVTVLAVLALWGTGVRSPRPRMWLAVVVGSILLSLLPRLPGFGWVHDSLPPLAAIRCYSRAGQLALVGMAVLAGFGTARLLTRLGRSRTATLLGVALVALINVEALRAPLTYRPFAGVPAIYDRLRDEADAVVVELPFHDDRVFFRNTEYMINATRHRHPIVNGYSGFAPPHFAATTRTMREFPSDATLALMRELGVTHVVVHRTSGMEEHREAIDASPALQLLVEQDRIAIYRLVGR